MQGKSSRKPGYGTALWSATLLMGLSLTLALGQDVILNPVDITGRVEIGNEPLIQVSMRAESGSFLATQTFTPDAADLTVVEYSLTVDVPEGGDRTYAVQPDLIYMDEYHDILRLAPQDVVVSDGVPGSADFIVTPGYLEGIITNESSRDMGTVQIDGFYPDNPGSSSCYSQLVAPCFKASTDEERSFSYRIAVMPGTGIHLHPRIYLGDGTTITLDTVVVDIAAGATVVQDFVLPAAEGSVSGTLAMPGAETPARHTVVVNGPGQHVAQLDESGPFELLELADGSYSIFFTSYFGDNPSRLNNFNHPYANITPSRSFTIENGSAATVDASTEQAYLEGVVSVTDSASPDDVTFLTHYFTGSSQESFGGTTSGYVDDPATGAYRFVLSQGTWGLRQVAVSIEKDGTQLADQFAEFIRITYMTAGAPPLEAVTGETSTYDISIPMGKVTVRFGVAGGLPLSDPRLEIGCDLSNESGDRMFSYAGNSRGQNQVDVTEAITSFLAPEGACLLTARAIVNGTLTSFGQVEVEVEPGVTKVIDVGAPTLTIDYPSPDLHVTDPILVVLGRASDDVEVTSVTVNGGAPLTLTSTGNEDDPNEVSFSGQELALAPGANVIETTAWDGADNSTTDTRTVFYDGVASPPVLNWTPADGTETSEANIEITGTADDAEGIESITVEGVEVGFTSTDNSAKPNEVAFTTSMVLVPGENLITVVASNVDELQTSQTHAVTLIEDGENTAPVADAGDDITQLCDGACEEDCGTLVTLDGSGSSDDDGDDLTYTWTGPFPEGEGTVTGVMPQVTLPLGTHEITLTVDDGSEQDTDTVMVTVEVKVIGLSPPLAGLAKAGERPRRPRHSFNHGRTLPLRFGLYCSGIALGKDDVEAPEIVGLVDDQGVEVDLSAIDLDSGKSNGDTLFFRHGDDQWVYNLNTKVLNDDTTYTITIRMPGGQDYQASFTLREGRSSSSRGNGRKR